MARRGESVFKRKDGRWEARYPCGVNEKGKTKYRSVYGKTYREAKEARMNAIKTAPIARTPKLCFSVILEKWLAHKRLHLKEQTCRRYEHCIQKHIAPCLGQLSLYEISEEVIDNFLQSKREAGRIDGTGGLSQNSVRTIAILLQSVFSFAFESNLGLQKIPTISKPKGVKKRISILKCHEQLRLEELLKQGMQDGNLAIYLSLHTGLRIGEICALRWDDVDFVEKYIHVCSTVIRDKNGACAIGSPKSNSSDRFVPITETLAAYLSVYKQTVCSEYVFPSPKSRGFLNPRTLQYRFKSVLKACCLPDVPFHALRHTFATRWIECGMDMKSLSEILGHASVNITLDIYVHSSDTLKRKGMERLEDISGQDFGHVFAGGVA